MQTITHIIDERLANAGDTLAVRAHVSQEGYELGGHAFSLPEGIDYDIALTNAGEGILVSGMLSAHVVGSCDRCLEQAEFDVHAEVDEYFLFKAPEVSADLSDDEDGVDYALVSADHTIDLTDALSSALVMETPYVVLCREDCRGLCPVCGGNLNESDCGHAAQLEQQRAKSSPFAVLKDLDLDN